MIGFILLAAALGAAPPVEANDASLTYVQCLFATSREASGARLSTSAFEQKLANACTAEQSAAERSLAKVLAQRGEANASAAAREVASAARPHVIDTYRNLLELEPQLKKIAEMCRAHPEQCPN